MKTVAINPSISASKDYFNKIDDVFTKQKKFFDDGNTLDVPFRKEQLRKFKAGIKKFEQEMYEAIYKDFNKSSFDTYLSEISLIINDIDYAISNLDNWTKHKRVKTNILNIPASSKLISEPYGNSFIIGAWNYPFLLTLHPVVSCIAAGNVAIVKPSGTSSNSSDVMVKMLNDTFPENYIFGISGRGDMVERVMDNPFDKIFFTGSPSVGKQIMRKASDYLANVSLELGGKNPCVFTEDAMSDSAFQRLAWGKYFNAGQTCVAPDYALVPENAQDKFLEGLKKGIEKVVGGTDYKNSDFYCQIISERHIKRFESIIPKDKVFYGGEFDIENRYLSPTILRDVSVEDEIMKDEIFGPILPVLTYKNIDDAIKIIKKFPKPLSFHYYTKTSSIKNKLLREVPSGTGGINDSMVFMANHNLPFGGVGNSGNGKYHGKFGFDDFSNTKGVLDRMPLPELPFKYLPYSGWKKKIIEFMLKL